MSDTPPSPPPTAADAAQARDDVEEAAVALYAAAVTWVALHEPEEDPQHDGHLMRLATILAIALANGHDRWIHTPPPLPAGEAREAWLDRHARAVTRRAVEDAREHHSTVSARVLKEDPDVSERMVRSTFRADKAWTEAAARTMATRLAAESAMSMHEDVEEFTGEKHSLLWISRGDPKVRTLHRRLHGKVRPPGTPFHTWSTGQELKYPGDPKAPLDATINCRCALMMVPSADAKEAEDIFEVPDADFDVPLAASGNGNLERDRAERELYSELSRRYL